MKHFFIRLLPPRPDVARTMTATEAALMEQHAAYWKALHDAREVVAYGLGVVADPRDFYGVSIVQVADDNDADALVNDDPTIKAEAGFRMKLLPMPRAVIRA